MSKNQNDQISYVPNLFDGSAWDFDSDYFRLAAFIIFFATVCFLARACYKIFREKYVNERISKTFETRANYRIRLKEIEHFKGDKTNQQKRRPE